MVLRAYDTALAEFLRLHLPKVDEFGRIIGEDDVPQAFATPRRAFMFNPETVKEMSEFRPSSTPRLYEPRSVLYRTDMTFAYDRFVSSFNAWRHIKYSDDLNEIMVSQEPLPFDISYQYDVITRTFHDYNLTTNEINMKFYHPVVNIDVTLPDPWGTLPIQLLNEGISDLSQYETGEEQRLLRFVCPITLFAWVPLPPRWVKTVQKISLDVVMDSTNEILQHLETEYADKTVFRDEGKDRVTLEWK